MMCFVIKDPWIAKECDACQPRQTRIAVVRMVFCLLALFTVGCSTTRIPISTQDEVIGIANRVVKELNYDLERYEEPDAIYQYAKDDNQWWVFYRLKPKQPLHHMSVLVHDKTKKVKFYPPE